MILVIVEVRVRDYGFSAAQQEELWTRWRSGESLRCVARGLGAPLQHVRRFLLQTGGLKVASRCRSVRHLTAEEREEISRGIAAGMSARAIARGLDRPASTVSREVARNGGRDAYRALNNADLWWWGKHKHHGGNIQVICAPDGWPLWTSDARPGREHDVSCARAHGTIDALAAVGDDLKGLADLGYEGEAEVLRVPVKKRKKVTLTGDQKTYNKLLRGVRGISERANALLIVRFQALRRVTLDPNRIGAITRAAPSCTTTTMPGPSEDHRT